MLLFCAVCAAASEPRGYIPSTPPEKALEPLGTPGQKAEDDLIISPYATGYLTYRDERLIWFAAVEKRSNTVGVVIMSQGRRDFRTNAGPDVFLIRESMREQEQVVTYLSFLQVLCGPAALERSACAFKEFTDDIVAKLRRIPEFVNVCVGGYVGMSLQQTLVCQPTK